MGTINSEIVSRDFIYRELVRIVEEMTQEWDDDFDDTIHGDTGLINDLAFESIDVVEFVMAIEEDFSKRGLPFEKLLMEDGVYVIEITIKDTVEFLFECLNNTGR